MSNNMHTRKNRMRISATVNQTVMRGVVAVEFAILLIPLITMAFGVVEYGRAIYHYNALVKAVRDGTRLLTQNNPADASYANRQAEARCLVLHGNINCSGPTLVPGLAAGHVLICDRVHFAAGCAAQPVYENVPTGQGLINLVEIRITGYQYNYLGLPLGWALVHLTSTTFDDIRSVMRQIV